MTPAERTAKIAELRAEADRLEREGKRNWPEKVEKGGLFAAGKVVYMWCGGTDTPPSLVDISDSFGNWWFHGAGFDGDEDQFVYLGHARDLLAIKTPDAHEPTGAELVGKRELGDDEVVRDGDIRTP